MCSDSCRRKSSWAEDALQGDNGGHCRSSGMDGGENRWVVSGPGNSLRGEQQITSTRREWRFEDYDFGLCPGLFQHSLPKKRYHHQMPFTALAEAQAASSGTVLGKPSCSAPHSVGCASTCNVSIRCYHLTFLMNAPSQKNSGTASTSHD